MVGPFAYPSVRQYVKKKKERITKLANPFSRNQTLASFNTVCRNITMFNKKYGQHSQTPNVNHNPSFCAHTEPTNAKYLSHNRHVLNNISGRRKAGHKQVPNGTLPLGLIKQTVTKMKQLLCYKPGIS